MSSSPLSLEERRRRRDQRMAVETANQIVQQAATRGRTVTLEWAAVAVLLAAGVGMVLGAWRRTEAPSMIGAACWGGLLLGGLICHAVLQPGQRQRLMMLGLAL